MFDRELGSNPGRIPDVLTVRKNHNAIGIIGTRPIYAYTDWGLYIVQVPGVTTCNVLHGVNIVVGKFQLDQLAQVGPVGNSTTSCQHV
jgi:hypothetical protein